MGKTEVANGLNLPLGAIPLLDAGVLMHMRAKLMKNPFWVNRIVALLMSFSACSAAVAPAFAGESSMPPSWVDNISPELADKYVYTEDGEFTQALKIPTYQWMPVGDAPKVVFLGIHGLTLHGRRFRVLARSLAVNGAGFIALDMRGFGRCKFDDKHQFSTPEDNRTKIDHHKSYDDIVKLATMIKQKYPDSVIVAMGESLGCTFCVQLAAEHPEIVSGVVLSAPAVHLNKDMYRGKGQILQGVKAALSLRHKVDLSGFFTDLCSNREDVRKELVDDPMVLKELTLEALVATDAYCAKTAKFGKGTAPSLAVLILQGSADGCVSPKHVTDLMNAMRSDDQSLEWRGNFGHLQLETGFMRAPTVSAIANWLIMHSKDRKVRLKELEQQITNLGGSVSK